MANLFDTSNYPDTEPYSFVVGDRVAWKRTDLGSDYPNSSYTLSYQARQESSGVTTFTATASSSGDDYVVEIGSTTSASYTSGRYHWSAYITRNSDSERIEIDSGTFDVKPNKVSSTADPRTHIKKVLDSIESVIEGRASKDQESLSVEGMTLSRTPIEDLLTLHSKYKAMYIREHRTERMKNGKNHSAKIFTRFQ